MIRESVAAARKRTFLTCRYLLILATGALTFREISADSSPLLAVVVVGTALASNLALSEVESFSFFDARFQAPVLVADTAIVWMSFLLTRASQECFLFFGFLLIVVAKVENLITLGACAVLIGIASVVYPDPTGAPSLMRVPFMFAVGLFFGYVVRPERTGEMVGFNRRPPAIGRGSGPGPPLKSSPQLKNAAMVHR